MNPWFIAFALILIVILSTVALYLWRKVWRLQAEEAKRRADAEQKRVETQAYIIESLQVICHTLLREEMNISEGAIRLKVLLDNLGQPERGTAPYTMINQLHDAVSHFDTHEVRSALPKIERRLQDAKREALEDEHRTVFSEEVQMLLQQLKPRVH